MGRSGPDLHPAAAGLALALLLTGVGLQPLRAQDTRAYTPEGFEFPLSTPALTYHFPRAGLRGSRYRGVWIAETVEGIKGEQVIDSAEIEPGALPVVVFTLRKSKGDWPPGLYRLEISADGQLVHRERFLMR